MEAEVFRAFRELAYEHAGIALHESKTALVSARVAKRLRVLGLSNEREYLHYLTRDASGAELVSFLDAISTNFTSFFREPDHFELLKSEVTQWREEGRRRIRVWCAAAATGEEPYTLAMTLAPLLDRDGVDWRLLATDISVRALGVAEAGVYEGDKLSRVPGALRKQYFEAHGAPDAPASTYRVKSALRERVVFRRLNLARPPFPISGPLDAIFCRNVMIYFDVPVRQRLVSEMQRVLAPGGLLVIAHAETLSGVEHEFVSVRPSVYRKR